MRAETALAAAALAALHSASVKEASQPAGISLIVYSFGWVGIECTSDTVSKVRLRMAQVLTFVLQNIGHLPFAEAV